MSFMVDFGLYILSVAFISNNFSRSSNYNAYLLQKIFKETFGLDIYRFTKLVVIDITNSETGVAHFFSIRYVQVDYEMHQLK